MEKLLNVCFLLSAAECGSRSLLFLSTGRVQPGHRPSFEQLTVLDGVPVSHCDGWTRTETFKPALKSKNLPKSCERPYVDVIESLREIPPLINRTVYVVQRRRGCVHSADGKDSAFEAWSVNGKDFMTFDPESQRWTPQSLSAGTVKQTWDKKRARNVAFSLFIRKQCPDMMDRIQFKSMDSKTDVNIFAKPVANPSQALLICHVTSTDRSTSSLHLIGGGASSAIRMTVSRPLPGPEDGSVVLRLTAQISLSQLTYRCTVQTAQHNISIVWDGKTLDGRPLLQESRAPWKTLTIILGVLSLVLTVTITSSATICLLKCVKMKSRRPHPPDPRLVEQFSMMMQDVMSPDLQSVIVCLIQDAKRNKEVQDQWEQNMRMRDLNHYDPDYFARQSDGANE